MRAQAGLHARQWTFPALPSAERSQTALGSRDLVSGRGQALNQVLSPLVLLPLDTLAAALPGQLQLHLVTLQALLPLYSQRQLLLVPAGVKITNLNVFLRSLWAVT